MLLSIVVGNSSVSFALFDLSDISDKPIVASKISANKNCSADEYAVLIKQILDLHLGSNYSITESAIASVVPSVTITVARAAEILSGKKAYIIGPGTKTGFKISINDPACLGSDIVANTAAAFDSVRPPFIIFDSGTANTITVVDENGVLIGTVIMPGITISASALYSNAELLDPISLYDKDIPVFGKTTEESVRSGLINGSAIMVDGFIRNIRESLIQKDSDIKLGLIATGDFAETVISRCRNRFVYDETLTLRGVTKLFCKNTRK